MSNLSAALKLSEQGFSVFPLGGPGIAPRAKVIEDHGGDVEAATLASYKMPLVSWRILTEHPLSTEQIEKYWLRWPTANIGLCTGVDCYVVDGDSQASCEWIEKSLTRATYRVKTGRGMHYYYAVKKGTNFKNTVDRGAKVDVRGIGGYVAAAGSLHESGSRYEADIPAGETFQDITDFTYLTDEDIALIRQVGERNKKKKQEYTKPSGDLILRLSEFNDLAEPTGEITEQGERNIECARHAGKRIREGLSQVELVAEMLAWNELNIPPLGENEVIRTVESVVKTHYGNTGEMVPMEPVVATVKVAPESMLISFADLQDYPPDPVESFMDNVLFDGARTIIAGEPKIGKSQFTLALGIAAATGGHFLNFKFERPLRFLWMQAEIHKSWLLSRMARVTCGLSQDEINLCRQNLILTPRLKSINLTGSDVDKTNVRNALMEAEPDLWAIDPIIQFSTVEENSNVEVSELLTIVDNLADAARCSPIIVHHVGKAKKGQTVDFDSIRGASAFRGWYDTGMILSGKMLTPMVNIETRNTKSPGAFNCAFNEMVGKYECSILDDDQTAKEKIEAAENYNGYVGDYLSSHGGEALQKDIIDHLVNYYSLEPREALIAIGEYASVYGIKQQKDSDGNHYLKINNTQGG